VRSLLHPLLLVLSLAACQSPATPSTEGPGPSTEAAARAASPAASPAEIEAWIEKGRVALDAGRLEEAEALFARAVAADDSLATQRWLLRTWMDQGRSDETLDALDALGRAGQKGPELDYLYGMAFARRAETLLREGVTDNSVQMNFLDATELLGRTLDGLDDTHADGYPTLARAAWYAQDLEAARAAADRAVEHFPGDARAWVERGKIVMSQFVVQQKAGEEGAEANWAEAVRSLQRGIELYGSPTEPESIATLTDAATELGHAQMWKRDLPAATQAYAAAMSWNPEGFDYGQVLGLLRDAPADPEGRPVGFRAALEGAESACRERAGQAPATLLWWLGWARFVEADWEGSELAFTAALAQRPDFVNAWFYVGLARQYRKNQEGALAAMHTGWDADPAAMVTAISGAGGSLRAFESLIGWCDENEKPLEAAFLSEMLSQTFPREARYWNNLGLFLRDEGERLEFKAYTDKLPAPPPEVLDDLYTRAYRAYRKALELNPDDPQLINDTAVMLDFHLDIDQDQVEPMYRQAIARAEALLAEEGLEAFDRERFETTLKDATENLDYWLHPGKREAEAEKRRAEREAKKAQAEAEAAAAEAKESAGETPDRR
jgi:tetratricopeptide (TPR) repeat protein